MQELEPGRVIQSRYRLDAEIGRGGFGTVWRATQLGVERPVAIKFLRTDLAPDARLRFDREARSLGMLNHPGCVTLHDFGVTEDGQPFLVTEFVHGESLNAWRRRDHTMDEILEVARQLSSALAHAHRHQLVHRDLKPANVMITRDDGGRMQVKVLDFGVARMAGDRWPDITKTGVVIGTPGYMSPEQLIGGELSPKTDLYALGVLLFELVEGGPPFRAESSLKLAMRHIKEDAPRMTRGPAALVDLVAALLSRHPDDRPISARHVAETLEGIEATGDDRSARGGADADVTVQRAVPTTPFESRRVSARRPTVALIALLGIAVVALLGVVITLLSRPEPVKPPEKSRLSQVLNPEQTTPEVDAGAIRPAPDAGRTQVRKGSAGCGEAITSRGATTVSTVEGLDRRSVEVFIPQGYDSKTPQPAIVVLHDAFESSAQVLSGRGFGPKADKNGVVLILPRDNSIKAIWRKPEVLERTRSDIELAMERLCLDPEQLFIFGGATAGSAVDQLICDVDFAAAAVSGHRFKPGERMCDGGVVPYLIFHQTAGFEPPEGGADCLGEPRVSIAEQEATLVERNRCEDRRERWKYKGSTCYEWTCAAELVSCHVDGGRPWYGEPRIPCEGTPADFPYIEVVWGFFFQRDEMFPK